MTLLDIVRAHPTLFYLNNRDWYRFEDFALTPPTRQMTLHNVWTATVPGEGQTPVRAVELADLYVRHPQASLFRSFLWTDDVDAWGNRVYVGGLGEFGIQTFQIHRRLEPNARWVWAT